MLENAGDPQTTYEASLHHYVLEAGPSTVGTPQPLDVGAVEALCSDKDGCQITLQMSNWDPENEPGATASYTTWLFDSANTNQWRFDEGGMGGTHGVDVDGSTRVVWQLYDCYFGDGEAAAGGQNGVEDIAEGFGLLNCGGPFEGIDDCAFSDATTICRVVLRD